MIEAVVFDFDGTIMDTNGIVMASWQHTYRQLTGREGERETILRTFGEPLEKSLSEAFPDKPLELSLKTYRDFHRDNFLEMIELFPGIREMLAEIKAAGYKMGLATSRVKTTTYQGMAKYNLEDFFDAVVTVEDVSKHKPDPESFLVTASKLGVAPEKAVMVGDTRFDILCGKNAGAKTILVGWSEAMSEGTYKEENSLKPDFVLENPADLKGILERI